jgi:hypothetical protein
MAPAQLRYTLYADLPAIKIFRPPSSGIPGTQSQSNKVMSEFSQSRWLDGTFCNNVFYFISFFNFFTNKQIGMMVF